MNYCEDAATNLLPTIRALIAKELKEKYNLTQEKIAELMDITQPAVSQYLKESRGKNAKKIEKNDNIMKIIEEIAFRLKNNDIKDSEISKKICQLCKIYSSEKNCILEV
ncbi:MAG: helix-turn-helix domain-containing protein [Candidatus Aenigmarchaeota archaeon]|nr:helix-turn-helix domain-containing protein [Candidatus Aenigmarchaeota archaeon]MBU5689467.1 helix-turn-helix domain-containing protein [Candidatus Aenigmarchaeota archaeon]